MEERVNGVLASIDQPGLVGKRMFGGVGFLVHGNMACGVHKERLIVRVGQGAYERALTRPFTREFDITGPRMKGWVMVEPEGCPTDDVLLEWVREGIDFALSLPAK